MAVIFTDLEIKRLLAEAKPYKLGDFDLSKMNSRIGHRRMKFQTEGAEGNIFVVHVRRSELDIFNFTVLLGVPIPGTTTLFVLRRYNGKTPHREPIRGIDFHGFHIHTATEMYQSLEGYEEETFAELTDRYSSLEGAIKCMLEDCCFILPPKDPDQADLFL